jgi:transposase
MGKSSKGMRGLQVVNPKAAGIDVGSRVHYVAIPDDGVTRSVESFGCVTPELERMAEWLQKAGVTTVALESTGVYWIPVCVVLEDHGFEVVVFDPRQAKNYTSRKSDVQDCAWTQQLHTFGLLSKAFRPTPEIQVVRDYWRQRTNLVQDAATQIHRIQKSLEQMNLQLHKVLSDITGVSGLRILRAIAKGTTDPEALAQMVESGIKATPKEIKEALHGHYREQHVFLISQALKTYDYLHERIREFDSEIESVMNKLNSRGKTPLVAAPAKRRKNQPHFNLGQEIGRVTGVDLTIIPGISALTAQTVISECGIDLAAFETEHHFASWLGLSPNNKKTGGRVFSSHTRLRPSPAATCLRIAAQSLQRSKSHLGDLYRSLRARIGAPKAITAIAHRLAKLIYRGLTRGQAYLEKGLANLSEKTQLTKLQALQRRAAYLGYQITPISETV